MGSGILGACWFVIFKTTLTVYRRKPKMLYCFSCWFFLTCYQENFMLGSRRTEKVWKYVSMLNRDPLGLKISVLWFTIFFCSKGKILTFSLLLMFWMAKGMMLVGEEGQLRRLLAGEIQVVVKSGTEVVVTWEIDELMTEIHPSEEGHRSDLTVKNVCLFYCS